MSDSSSKKRATSSDEGDGPREKRKRTEPRLKRAADTTIEPTGTNKRAKDLHADMTALVTTMSDENKNNTNLSIATLGSMLADMSADDLRNAVSRTIEGLPEPRLRDLYSALVDHGFIRAIEAVHERVKELILTGGTWTVSDALRTFGCHPTLTMAVVAPLAQDAIFRTKRDEEAAADEKLENGDLDTQQISGMIKTLEPGQCALVACDGGIEDDDDGDDGGDEGYVERFDLGGIILRMPKNLSFPDFSKKAARLKLKRRELLSYAKMSDAEYRALSEEARTAKRRQAFRDACADRRFKGAWRTLEMDPPLVPEGDTGLWLQWFIASKRIQSAPDGEFPEALTCRMQNAGLIGPLDDSAEYLVMNFPSNCGQGRLEMAVKVSDSSDWVGEEYPDNGSSSLEDVDEPDAFAEEAYLCRTLEEAVRRATEGSSTVDLVVKATRRGQPTEVLYRSKRVDPGEDTILLG